MVSKGGWCYQRGFMAGKGGFVGSHVGVDGGTEGTWFSAVHAALLRTPGEVCTRQKSICLPRQGAGFIPHSRVPQRGAGVTTSQRVRRCLAARATPFPSCL